MLHVAKPTIPPIDVFRACYKGMSDANLTARLKKQESHIQERSDAFEKAADAGSSFSLPPSEFKVPTVLKTEIEWLYNQRLVNSAAGRRIYLNLRGSARDGLCSLCGIRPASTLDHHMAKVDYLALAVNPLNLVPACFECNHGKGSALLDTPHPYFDDFHLQVWLTAVVVRTSPCAVKFLVTPPPLWDASLGTRVETHFKEFGLGALFGAQAARQLSGNRRRSARPSRRQMQTVCVTHWNLCVSRGRRST